MAQAKKKQVSISADRAEQLKKSKVRAGKGKGSLAARKLQNAGVKDGTIKLGRGGKSYNVYDAKTGTWKKGVVKAAASKPKSGPSAQAVAAKARQRRPKRPSRTKGDFETWFTERGYPGVPYRDRSR